MKQFLYYDRAMYSAKPVGLMAFVWMHNRRRILSPVAINPVVGSLETKNSIYLPKEKRTDGTDDSVARQFSETTPA